jgi:AAA15 family ATPase/GTPase
MIVSFSVSNYRSFSSEEAFSLVASQRLGTTHEEHTVPIPDSPEKVLRTAVLYGANGPANRTTELFAIKFAI